MDGLTANRLPAPPPYAQRDQLAQAARLVAQGQAWGVRGVGRKDRVQRGQRALQPAAVLVDERQDVVRLVERGVQGEGAGQGGLRRGGVAVDVRR